MTLVAKEAFRYASRQLEAGEEFEPESESDARVLQAAGKATGKAEAQRVPDEVARKKRGYKRRDMKAEK